MDYKELIETLEIAKAEVEWNYPLNYYVAIEQAIDIIKLYEKRCEKIKEITENI